jgi:hypothetical protein
MHNKSCPQYVCNCLPPTVSSISDHNLRNNDNYTTPRSRLRISRASFIPSYVSLWNNLDINIRNSPNISRFKSRIKENTLSFYWKKWFYSWYMALAWWLVPCLPFPGLPHIYFLFAVRLTNERVGVFLARRSVQHLVIYIFVCAIYVDIIICVLFVGRGQSISCDNFLSNPIAVLFAIK